MGKKTKPSSQSEQNTNKQKFKRDDAVKYLCITALILLILFLIVQAPSFIKGWWSDMSSLFNLPTGQSQSQPIDSLTERSTVSGDNPILSEPGTNTNTTTNNTHTGTTTNTTTRDSSTTTNNTTTSNEDTLSEIVNDIKVGQTKDQVIEIIEGITPVCTIPMLLGPEICTFAKDGAAITTMLTNGLVTDIIKAGF